MRFPTMWYVRLTQHQISKMSNGWKSHAAALSSNGRQMIDPDGNALIEKDRIVNMRESFLRKMKKLR